MLEKQISNMLVVLTFTILESVHSGNIIKKKVAKAFFIKESKPMLKIQEKSVLLK